ncbi:hypothetical protein GCM10007874_52500 [Labrys miyagiensis]|uniref:Transposase n=1 Tax=Labrys miyagiensis TaxID=346912 RepID=A0ABQ6CPH9_9HYPH|nr:hypothetical protein GCM10007874_52500 [Labrys miyagiensis]
MVGKTKAHVVDGLASSIDWPAMTWNQVHNRPVIGIEPIAGKGEGRPIAWLQIQYDFQEGTCAFKIVGSQCDVIKHDALAQ